MIKWILNDKVESSTHTTKQKAIKEFIRLNKMDYKHITSVELLRYDTKTDIYTSVAVKPDAKQLGWLQNTINGI